MRLFCYFKLSFFFVTCSVAGSCVGLDRIVLLILYFSRVLVSLANYLIRDCSRNFVVIYFLIFILYIYILNKQRISFQQTHLKPKIPHTVLVQVNTHAHIEAQHPRMCV